MTPPPSSTSPSTTLPTKIGILLYPSFQLIDVAGPLDALNILSYTHPLTLSIVAATLTPISTQTAAGTQRGSIFAQSIMPTHTFETAPRDLDVVIVPGGLGMRGEGWEERMKGVGEWLEGLGLGLGLGEDRGPKWVKARHPNVDWIAKARWVVDGRFWTSSGVSAGIDLTYAWIGHVFGEDVAQDIADRSEYVRNTDAGDDGGFAERWGAI
ncbi:ThiJ/PfpI family protein [Pyrenophora teres f. maculata]|nr:ThiJ/PfpI family protein [Pyrenophora teres f. maculata]